ncbi:hypothetical protein LEP1GSC043_2418 [Leptospira weilii str. Ecochallenge]|uniref:Uncharacterized protein n=1 Tax=Leptospira weilii str. Ecochallenge TaxID=1049986 RepID=N1U2H7_9LEPT|nr:hypothetical protein LEP1GSC043_2418 [Leptospira weilii str. Ecochallenge]
MLFEADLRKSDLESVPKQFDLNGIPAITLPTSTWIRR